MVGALTMQLSHTQREVDALKAANALAAPSILAPSITPFASNQSSPGGASTVAGGDSTVRVGKAVAPDRSASQQPCNLPCNGLALSDGDTVRIRNGLKLPRCCAADGLSSEWMAQATEANQSLLEYFYSPHGPQHSWKKGTVDKVWRPISTGCQLVPDACYCFHVTGSPVKAENPHAWKDSVSVANNPNPRAKKGCELCKNFNNCSCLVPSRRTSGLHEPAASLALGNGCLFGDMRPGKLLAVIAACRRLGITHIIEEGRYGGLSAYVYALHGFKVTSIELLPIDYVADALRSSMPSIRQVTGDGSQLIPKLVRRADTKERIAVIFDGEKRQAAYKTYMKVAKRAHLVIFDDAFHERFHMFLDARKETSW